MTNPLPGPMNLSSLPAEVLLGVSEHLPAESKLALQIINRDVRRKIGNGVNFTHLSLQARMTFLHWLDDDGAYPESILCPWCFCFHPHGISSPFWGQHQRVFPRPCFVDPTIRGNVGFLGVSPCLPDTVHFNTVAALVRCHRLDTESFHPNMMRRIRAYNIPDMAVQVDESFKVIGDRLLMKTTKLLHRPATDYSCDNMLGNRCMWQRILHSEFCLQEVLPVCNHIDFTRPCPRGRADFRFLLCPLHANADDYFLSAESRRQSLQTDVDRMRCLWHHPQPCPDSDEGIREVPTGRIYSCASCYTDVSVVMRPSSWHPQYKVLMVTSWKDLGAGRDPFNDKQWQSHMKSNYSLPIRYDDASVYQAWEGDPRPRYQQMYPGQPF